MKEKILFTASFGCGKTTLIQKIIKGNAAGFYPFEMPETGLKWKTTTNQI